MIKHDKTHLLVSKFVIVCPNGLSSNVGWLFEGASFFSENIKVYGTIFWMVCIHHGIWRLGFYFFRSRTQYKRSEILGST